MEELADDTEAISFADVLRSQKLLNASVRECFAEIMNPAFMGISPRLMDNSPLRPPGPARPSANEVGSPSPRSRCSIASSVAVFTSGNEKFPTMTRATRPPPAR
mmetsp:Transcript_29644/g.64519  ORF Transcript_29644/g.64519 Transcript_29644/m.64519 type:complete len:104 (-) Transcript_29644:445-756(-)